MQSEQDKRDQAEDDALREAAHSPNRRKTALYIFVAVLVGLVVNTFMGLLMDPQKILRSLSAVSLWMILVPFAAYMCVPLVDSLRLWLVSRACQSSISFKQCVLNSMVGSFFAHVTPLAMGGQPFQIYHLHHHGMKGRVATNIIFSRFVVNAMLLVILLLVGIPVIVNISKGIAGISLVFFLGLSVTVLFAIVFLVVLIRPQLFAAFTSLLSRGPIGRLIAKLCKKSDWQAEVLRYTQEMADDIRFLWSRGFAVMLVDILLNVVDIALVSFAFWFPLRMLAAPDLSFLGAAVTYNAVWQVVFYIPSPGASGGLEGMFTAIFSAMTSKPEMILVAVFLWRFSTYYLSLIPGMILSSLAFRKHKPAAA